jgi:DNA (cytosine-5)-methyltransferase 1
MTKPKDPIGGFDATVCSVAEPLTFGSLFAGIGGIDLGFERAGLQCKWQVEIEPYAQKVLAKHWPNVRRHDDVRTWPQPDTEYVDVIAGGFPCQDISYAGKRAGLQGERSGLFYEAIRVVREVGPRFIVLENVAALLTSGMGDVLGTLASIGYDAEWHCIPAAAVGAPHIRDRIFILAYANESCESKGWLQRRGEQLRISGNHGEDQKRISPNAESDGRNQRKPNSRRREERVGTGKEHRPGDGGKAMANTNSSGLEKRQGKDTSGAGSICGTKPGRSEWWEFEPAVGRVANGVPKRLDRLRGLGNAVVPQVAEYIGRCIVAASKDVA